jgi:hypothetical protein
LTGGPFGSTITIVRVLLRLLVVLFFIVSLLVVAAVGVAASSGKEGSANAIKHSVVAVFSGHVDLSGFHEGSTNTEDSRHSGHQGDDCKPPKKHHHHATGDHEHNECGGDDSGSTG